MYFDSETIYEALKCSFCAVRFTDKIKLIPDCGSSICDDCYSDLNEDLDDYHNFKCKACREWHPMPPNGMPDDKRLMNLLKQKPQEKSLSAKAQTLKTLIEETQDRVCMLEATDGQEEINKHCDQLEVDVRETIECAQKHLKEMETGMLNRICNYRKRLLNRHSNASKTSSYKLESPSEELNVLSIEIDEFSDNWQDLFNRIDKVANDEDVERAINQQREYDSRLTRLEKQIKSELFEGKMLAFRINNLFFKNFKHLGELVEIKLEFDSTNTCSPKPDAHEASKQAQTPKLTKAVAVANNSPNTPTVKANNSAHNHPKSNHPQGQNKTKTTEKKTQPINNQKQKKPKQAQKPPKNPQRYEKKGKAQGHTNSQDYSESALPSPGPVYGYAGFQAASTQYVGQDVSRQLAQELTYGHSKGLDYAAHGHVAQGFTYSPNEQRNYHYQAENLESHERANRKLKKNKNYIQPVTYEEERKPELWEKILKATIDTIETLSK